MMERMIILAGDVDPDKKEVYVEKLFNAIARRYDLMNMIMTAGQWKYWQRRLLGLLDFKNIKDVLDVCCGTAELSLAIAGWTSLDVRIAGLDFSEEMLAVGRKKVAASKYASRIKLYKGNALALPFADNSFDLAVMGFALRNVAGIARALAEMTRVVRPGGLVVSMELSRVENSVIWMPFSFYFYRVVPLLGALVGREKMKGEKIKPYTYLPDSLRKFPGKEALAGIFREAGLEEVRYYSLSWGIVAVHTGRKPSR
jgi:demethylmenaquinone methyltransferase/2-methoxy-6-polyprenyl-1,4-benzoquinol methylase